MPCTLKAWFLETGGVWFEQSGGERQIRSRPRLQLAIETSQTSGGAWIIPRDGS